MTENHYKIFGKTLDQENILICFSGTASSKPFQCLAVHTICGLDLLEKTRCLPLYRYTKEGERIDNISDWGLEQFTHYYQRPLTKKELFYYVYGVLHDPKYRKRYASNLRQDFLRIPYYEDITRYITAGKALMDMHIHYEAAEEYPLAVCETARPKDNPKIRLRRGAVSGSIELDENTILNGIPEEAWEYRLGNKSALAWILDQYKEKRSDTTIPTVPFSVYKDSVIALLKKVCTISIKTQSIINTLC
ncbi:hypothetical protein PilKf_02512 [Pillotina sp. SPG140]